MYMYTLRWKPKLICEKHRFIFAGKAICDVGYDLLMWELVVVTIVVIYT
jgi:hypothetical protein